MHPLLHRQIRKTTAPDGSRDDARLLSMVDAAYEEADRERRIKDRAMAEMQRELEALHLTIRQDAEARLNVLMENVGEAVVIIDQRGQIESFNNAAERIFGYTADEVVGRNVSVLMREVDAAHHDETLASYVRTGQRKIIGVGRETLAIRKNGEAFPIELAVGEVTGTRRRFIGVIRDITVRKLAERQLRESESRFRDLADAASDWFWETDPHHRLSFASERISAVLGVNPSAVLGTTFFDLGLADDPAAAAAHAADLAACRPFRDRLFHVGPKEGKDSHILRISGMPIYGKDGTFHGYRGVGIDVTREIAAERRAREAQQQLADAIESLVDGIAVFDANDKLVICNRTYRHVFVQLDASIIPGTSFESVLRWNSEVFDTEGLDFEEWAQRRIVHHREASGRPFIVHMADGRWILHRECRMADGGVVGVRTDITEIKRREQEVEALKKRYKLILDSAGDGIVGLDPTGAVIFANRMAGAILGYEADALVGSDFTRVLATTEASRPEALATWYDGNARQVEGEHFNLSAGGTVPVDYYIAPLAQEDGGGAVLVFRDATLRLQYERGIQDNQRELERQVEERTRALMSEVAIRSRTEAALWESRDRLKGVTDSLFEGVLVVNRSGFIVFANPAARRLLCAGETTELEGLPVDDLFRLGEGGVTDFDHSPWRYVATEGGTHCDDDAIFVTTEGRRLQVAYACVPQAGIDGPRNAIISFRDITALKEAQKEALQASRMASVGQLAAGIAHEINTPTQYIGDNLRFVLESFESFKEVVDNIRPLAREAANLGLADPAAKLEDAMVAADLDYLLDEVPTALAQSLEGVAQVGRIVLSMKEFSHPGTGTKTMTDINRALDSTLTVSRNTWKHVADVELNFAPDLPPIPCFAGELNQVFLNLIVNAAHAIEASGKPGMGLIRITTECDGTDIIVTIADSGTGIAASIRDQIFDPFFTTKPVGKGTGQGLAICRDVVVTKHGGRIDLGGREGDGATFIIRLPVTPTERTAEGIEESAP